MPEGVAPPDGELFNFNLLMSTTKGSDCPNKKQMIMNKRQKLELAFRQHTKEVLGENAVKEFAGSELEALCVTFIQKQGQALPLVDVSGLFEFSKFLNDNFEYFDNIEAGDVYKCKLGTGLYSEKQVYEKYLSSK